VRSEVEEVMLRKESIVLEDEYSFEEELVGFGEDEDDFLDGERHLFYTFPGWHPCAVTTT
jgi:hypothetical protein